ncbi:MAG: sodium:proton antiporter [Nitrospirae bacterium]|nr:sodium:proton antiporter [Candidatus Manganitrophaceae bacterium]
MKAACVFLIVYGVGLAEPLWAASEATPSPVHPLWMIPFWLLLLMIAVAPFIHETWWEHNYPPVALGLGCLIAVYYSAGRGETGRVWNTASEYISFIALVGSLYTVTGGVWVHIQKRATPLMNTGLLLIGSILSNLVGTTGASVLLIRAYLRMNRGRVHGYHLVFFIFLVGNVSGMLTPVGDPPLFLGYLKGIPFFWPLQALWPIWGVSVAMLLGLFYLIDRRTPALAATNSSEQEEGEKTVWIEGKINFLFLIIILISLFQPSPLREISLIVSAMAGYALSKKEILERNGFNFIPIKEVAILFFGIFMTMIPTLDWLTSNAAELGLSAPIQFFWITGLLSAMLDNAPTYLTFLSAAFGLYHLNIDLNGDVGRFLTEHAIYLRAVSAGAVLFGAMTYIGNAPNFLVKTIATQAGIAVPTFLGYTKYSVVILMPLFLLIGFLFFS